MVEPAAQKLAEKEEIMLPVGGLLRAMSPVAGAVTIPLEYPLHGILGEMLKSTYKDAAVPDDEDGYAVMGRPLHKDAYPDISKFEYMGRYFPTLHHYQFIGQNGENIGFAPGGEFSEQAWALPEYTLGTPFGSGRYDAKVVKKGIEERQKAIEAIRDLRREDPDMYGDIDDPDLGTYDAILNNCHDYISDVLWRGTGRSGR